MSRLYPLAALFLLAASPALAQRSTFGLGGQVGDPTGITLRAGAPGSAIDLAAGWNLSNNAIFVQGHLIMGERRLGAAPSDLRLFYGPGLFLGVRDRDRSDDEVTFGLSLNAGLSYFAGPVEIFGQLTPRLQLVDETDFILGGALGLRYYF
jgi:hypothetical protein